MKKTINLITALLLLGATVSSQPTIYPAPENNGLIYITHATIHVGNGNIINDGTIRINKGKIENVGTNIPVPAGDVKVYDVKGKQVYPGLINSITNLGIKEVSGSVRGTNDYAELGNMNPSVRSIVAYNTDSRVINVLRTNG
ncbi:MAG TPA: amidohydrolase, partial [Hanamia sp.]|nr:amidohydrolase [Hanamia sp.]